MAVTEPPSWRSALDPVPEFKARVANLVTQEDVPVMFNPTEIETAVEVGWQRFTVPGLSHQPKHYVNTSNTTIPLALFYRATTLAELDQMRDKRNFFESLAYPVESDQVVSGGPPRFLFIWPKHIALICTMNSVRQRDIAFTREGRPRIAQVNIEIEEIRNVRLLSSDVRRFGHVRAGSRAARESFLGGG
jgi:hypothetical protein